MKFDLVVKKAKVFLPTGPEITDVGVADGRIVEIGDLSAANAAEVVDGDGKWLIPGVIDTQVHFREPGLEHKEDLRTGAMAAVAGGTTTVFEMPNTNPLTINPEALGDKLSRASGRMASNFAFFVGASPENLDELASLEALPGTPGIKVFMGSSTGSLLVEDDASLRKVLANGHRPVAVHSEDEPRNRARRAAYGEGTLEPDPTLDYPLNGTASDHPHVRDAESARLSTERLLKLSEETGRTVHILHLSTANEIDLIASFRKRIRVSVEITPQHLFFEGPDCYDRQGTHAQMNPPMRSRHHRDALREAFRAGFFNVIGSDHAPHTLEEKAAAYPATPSGMPGVQTLLPVMLRFAREGLTTFEEVVRLTSAAPAELYGIKDRGNLQVGSFADMVLIDPREFTVEANWLRSKCGWSPYLSESLFGWPLMTWVGGKLAYSAGGELDITAGRRVEFDWK
jgi:dihydroorotase